MQARYYDPVIGRFYSNDPIDTLSHLNTPNGTHGFNRYAYANNNPYKFTDPDGRAAVLACIPAAAACGAAVQATVNAVGAIAVAVIGAIAENASNDPVEGILDGASEGEKTKGRTENFDKPGGMDQANDDFDSAVDPESVTSITDSKGGEGRRGTVNDGSGRSINVRPNSSDGRPTVEIQDGKDKIKIRYDDEKQ